MHLNKRTVVHRIRTAGGAGAYPGEAVGRPVRASRRLSEITLTLVYAAYVVGNVLALAA